MSEGTILARLRRLTEEALQRSARQEAEREAAEAQRAQDIIAALDQLAEEQARQGQHFAVVMDVAYQGKPRLFQPTAAFELDPECLCGASKAVWDYCVEAGLDPVLVGRWTQLAESQHRVDFSLVIRW